MCVAQEDENRTTHGVEVGDDFVQEPEALEALIVDALLAVEIREVRHTGEQDAHLRVALAVKIVVVSRVRQKVSRDVRGQNVVYKRAVSSLHVRRSFPLRDDFPSAKVQHPSRDLSL